MQLHITNFRSIIDRQIVLPENGTVSITGASGAGKSTILDAIHFALFGARLNVAPKGENVSTKVKLTMNDLTVTRQKKPNLLIVIHNHNEYEGDSAQGIINKIFGSEPLFSIASYIKQGRLNGFVSMSEAAKKSLIMDLAIGYDIETLKKSLDVLIKDGANERTELQRNVEHAEIRFEPYAGKNYSPCDNVKAKIQEFKELQASKFNDGKLRDELVKTKTILEYQPNTNLTPEQIAEKLKAAETEAKQLQSLLRTNQMIIEKKKELSQLVVREPLISEADLSRLKHLKPHKELVKLRDDWKTYTLSQSVKMECPYCKKSVHKLGDKLHRLEDTPKVKCSRPKAREPSEDDIAFALKHTSIDVKAEEQNWKAVHKKKALAKFENLEPKSNSELTAQLETIQETILETKKLRCQRNVDIRPIAEIELELAAEQKRISETKSRMNILRKAIKEHKLAYEAHKLRNELRDCQVSLDEIDAKLTSLERLKSAIDVSCSQLLDTFLASINQTINGVLKEIFDEPIDVQILSFKDIKTTKTTKAALNFEILYRGMVFNKLDGLSGGEQARVSLALLIAFAHMSPSKVVMIDESMASLHIDMRVSAIECLKTWLPEHLILIVNHDTSDSDYDFTLQA